MNLVDIEDIPIEAILDSQYDLAIFASGYESRCQYVSTRLNVASVSRSLIFGFEYIGDEALRRNSDEHFKKRWGASPIDLKFPNDRAIYDLLNQEVRNAGAAPRRILVDYSSMSRAWYAAILNWLRFSELSERVVVDFVYAAGTYSSSFTPISIESILPLPGCEGSSGTVTKSIAVLGLGFEELAPLCVLDKLQPDYIFAYLASPAINDEYPRIARSKNAELIGQVKETLELPLSSVSITVAKLAEVISPYLKLADITFVPMGPKPHVLAAILLAIRFNQITCLHVHGKTQKAKDVVASGDVIATRVHFN